MAAIAELVLKRGSFSNWDIFNKKGRMIGDLGDLDLISFFEFPREVKELFVSFHKTTSDCRVQCVVEMDGELPSLFIGVKKDLDLSEESFDPFLNSLWKKTKGKPFFMEVEFFG